MFFSLLTAEVGVRGLIGDSFPISHIFQKDGVARIGGVAQIAEAALIGEEGRNY